MNDHRVSRALPPKSSRLGIISFLIAVFSLLIVLGETVAILYFQHHAALLTGFATLDSALTCLVALLALVGLVLGFIAVVRKEPKRAFGFLGLSLNGLFLLVILVLHLVNALTWMTAAGA